ncbi:P-loop containing nucleoside triphosphate hydrolase protein [Pholiota molesta]|nr:P-loop containing nucleoside triphosphate hydrolase protein [Pholiota molesta]
MTRSDLIPDGGDGASTQSGAAFIVVMGVSGTGKSTLGSALAGALRMPYVEGDDLHPQANVAKMAAGTPLGDADREPWLARIRATAVQKIAEAEAGAQAGEGEGASRVPPRCHGVVATCSALKRYYRDILRGVRAPAPQEAGALPGDAHLEPARPAALPTYFVFIHGSRELLMERMTKRAGHFMKASMLDSQLNTLESPVGEEGVVVVSIEDSTEEQVRKALDGLIKISTPEFSEYVKSIIKEEDEAK